jgi:hypothetical protein
LPREQCDLPQPGQPTARRYLYPGWFP